MVSEEEIQQLKDNKQSGFEYRKRRDADWDENYTLYRDKVSVNRLIQRQSVNLPLMKTQIRTLLKDVDEMPVLYFKNLDNNGEAQTFQNEHWKYTLECNDAQIKDIVDKRQVFLYGRSFDQWQIKDGKVHWEIEDPEDMLIDRYCDPTNIDSARFLVHTHIFKPLSVVEANPEYDQEAIAKLKAFYGTEEGLIKAQETLGLLQKKNEKMETMGVEDTNKPILAEPWVELSQHFMYHKEDGVEKLYLYVEADDYVVLMKKPLDVVIGKTVDDFWQTHFPYESWADDLERQDFWSDGIADIIRTPNKVLNSWFSQEVENRTLHNLNMHYYDSTLEGFVPQTYEPVAWGWYGIPLGPGRKIDDVIKTVEVPTLNGNLDDMNFLIQMIEKATGATATQQGVQTQREITLGEVQLALGEAKERVKGMSKFYTPAWKKRALKYLKLIEAAPDKIEAVKISKQGRNSQTLFNREITPKDWQTKSGYTVEIWSQDEKQMNDTDEINKLNAVRANIPNNPKLDEIYKRKLLEFAKLTPEQINSVMEAEAQKAQAIQSQGAVTPDQAGQPVMMNAPTKNPRTPTPNRAVNGKVNMPMPGTY